MNPITLTNKFRATLIEEYSATSRVTDLGAHDCEMTLYAFHPAPRRDCIVWNYSKGGEDDELVICLGLEGTKVVDYDGVFSLPSEAVALLKEAGLDTTEIE